MYFYVNIFLVYDPWYYANLLSKLLGLCHLVVTDYSLQYAQTLPIPDWIWDLGYLQSVYHHFICPIIQQYTHLHGYGLEEQDSKVR